MDGKIWPTTRFNCFCTKRARLFYPVKFRPPAAISLVFFFKKQTKTFIIFIVRYKGRPSYKNKMTVPQTRKYEKLDCQQVRWFNNCQLGDHGDRLSSRRFENLTEIISWFILISGLSTWFSSKSFFFAQDYNSVTLNYSYTEQL